MLWTEKYRPSTLAEVVGNDHLVATLKNFIQHAELPHLLLYGPPGLGKSSVLKALTNDIFDHGNKVGRVLEINASDERNIRFVRDSITTFIASPVLMGLHGGSSVSHDLRTRTDTCEERTQCSWDASNPNFKIVILEEADSLTPDAQFCLRRLMEIYASNARFCLTCNDVDRLIPAVKSRCCAYQFKRLNDKDMDTHLNNIANLENLDVSAEAIKLIIENSAGDLRKAVNSLQIAKASSAENLVDIDVVCTITGDTTGAHIHNLLLCVQGAENDGDGNRILMTFMQDNDISVSALINKIWTVAKDNLVIAKHLERIEASRAKFASDVICCSYLTVALRSLPSYRDI